MFVAGLEMVKDGFATRYRSSQEVILALGNCGTYLLAPQGNGHAHSTREPPPPLRFGLLALFRAGIGFEADTPMGGCVWRCRYW